MITIYKSPVIFTQCIYNIHLSLLWEWTLFIMPCWMLVFNNTQLVKKSIIFLHFCVKERGRERQNVCVCVCVKMFAGVTKPTFESFYTGVCFSAVLGSCFYLHLPCYVYMCVMCEVWYIFNVSWIVQFWSRLSIYIVTTLRFTQSAFINQNDPTEWIKQLFKRNFSCGCFIIPIISLVSFVITVTYIYM